MPLHTKPEAEKNIDGKSKHVDSDSNSCSSYSDNDSDGDATDIIIIINEIYIAQVRKSQCN